MVSLRRQVAEGVFIFSSTRLLITVLHFFSTIILIRSLGLSEYGLFVLALSFHAILSSFLDPGIGGVVLSDTSAAVGEGSYSKAKSFLKSYLKFQVFMGILLLIITLMISFLIRGMYNEVVPSLLFVVAFYLLAKGLFNGISQVFYSFSDFKRYNAILITEAIMKLFLVFIFIGLLGEGIVFAMVIYLVSQIVALLIVMPNLFKIINKLKKYTSSKEPLFRKMIRNHGKWIIFYFPIKKIGSEAHYWITQYFLGINAVALLGAAMRGVDILKVFLNSLEEVLFPITSSVIKNWERAKYLIKKSIKYNLWGATILAIPTIIFTPLLIEVMFSGKYFNSISVFRILLISLIPASLIVIKPLFYALKKQKYVFYSGVATNTLLIVLDIIFIWFFGLIGVAVSMIITSSMVFLIRYKFIRNFKPDFEIGLKDIFRVDEFDRRQFKAVMIKVKKKIKL